MKILLLFGCKTHLFNHRLNGGFMEKLRQLPGVENLWSYEYRTIAKLKTTPLTLYQTLQPDIVICYAHVGHLNVEDIEKIPCKKVCIEVDYYKNPHSKILTYKKCKFDLVLQRGAFQLPYFGIPTAWLPFSADSKIFPPLLKLKRKANCVGLAASIQAPIYSQRRIATNKLQAAGLLNICNKCFGDVKYSTFLRRTRIILTSTEINSPHGKLFETMASGSVGLTSSFNGEKELFGSIPCFIKYQPDCSDLVDQVKFYINNPGAYRELQLNSIKIFQEKHTDDLRLQELYQHLDNLLQDKPLVKPWGF
jgi:hypothetical protein